ncbi:hypothetical protein [Zavarzinella formosa]|uniref:hypothetical protein n=1 Tax=Zavarzinella formosa TaxID=360055 RepID=UPI00031BB497|nr:hypothetical protein [Zavarzinella formosa]
MAWLAKPESILTADHGTLELDDSGDPAVAAEVLRRLAERFGAVVRDHLLRNLMGDPGRERDYWYLIVRGREYLVMRCTAPEVPPGVCVMGPIGARDDLALFRAVAACFGATEQDRRSPLRPGWWRFWG